MHRAAFCAYAHRDEHPFKGEENSSKPLKTDSWLILTLFKIVLSICFLMFRGPFKMQKTQKEESSKNCEVLGENNSIRVWYVSSFIARAFKYVFT